MLILSHGTKVATKHGVRNRVNVGSSARPKSARARSPLRSRYVQNSGSHTRSPERPENVIPEPFPRQQRYFSGACRILPKRLNPEASRPQIQNLRTAAAPFAGKPAPTDPTQDSGPVIILWERVHPRRGPPRHHKANPPPPQPCIILPQIIKK